MNKPHSPELKVVGSNLVIKIKETKYSSSATFSSFLRMNDTFWIFISKGLNHNVVGSILEIFFLNKS